MSSLRETPAERRQRFSNEEHEYHDPSILLGEWFDERARREADFVDNAIRFTKGETTVQLVASYMNTLQRPVPLSRSINGFLPNKSIVSIGWSPDQVCPHLEHVFLTVLPFSNTPCGRFIPPCIATGASGNSQGMVRSSFYISRNAGDIPDDVPLMYGECVFISTVGPDEFWYLQSHIKTPYHQADRSGHQKTIWENFRNNNGLWKVFPKEKENRNRNVSGRFLQANANIIFEHVVTGRLLALEKKHILNTIMGYEFEISCNTYEDRLGRESEENFWKIVAPYEPYMIHTPDDEQVYGCRPDCVQPSRRKGWIFW